MKPGLSSLGRGTAAKPNPNLTNHGVPKILVPKGPGARPAPSSIRPGDNNRGK